MDRYSYKQNMKKFIQDEKAVSLTLEYALLISLAVVLMTTVVVFFNGLVADAAKQSITIQYAGLGNQISDTINDMYLTNCTNATRTLKIPYQIGSGESTVTGYSIEATPDYLNRPAIVIYSAKVTVYVPLNIKGRGNTTVNVTGNASSARSTRVQIEKRGNTIGLTNV